MPVRALAPSRGMERPEIQRGPSEYWQRLAITTWTWTPWRQAAMATYGTHGEPVDGDTPEAWNGHWVVGRGGVLTLPGANAKVTAFTIQIV